jgi:hypothetical protein
MESKPIRRFLAPAVFQQDSTIRRPSAHPKCPMLYIAVQSKCCISDFFRVACCGGPQSMESKPNRRFLAPAVFQQDSTIRRPSAHPKCPMLYIAVQSKCCISDFFRVACCGGPQSMESKPNRRFLAPAVFQQDSTIRRPSAHPKCPMLYIAVQSKCCISDFF